MTEGGLLSSVGFRAMAAENFVCVRIFSTALGGGNAEVRKFIPGVSETLQGRLMHQGNSILVLTPEGRIITTRYEVVDQSPQLEEIDVQMEEKIPGGLLQLRQVMKRFPAAASPAVATPWQFSPAHALVVAWDDNRRIVVVPSREGQIDAGLEKCLADPDLLKEFHSRYVFVKVGPEHAPPIEIRDALGKAGPGGMLILDIPETDVGCIGRDTDRHYEGPWARTLAAAAGPHTAATISELLRSHYIDLPTFVSRKCENARRDGKNVRTGQEDFDMLWRGAPASVRRQWSSGEVEDMREYTRRAIAGMQPIGKGE